MQQQQQLWSVCSKGIRHVLSWSREQFVAVLSLLAAAAG
jgi:hypothetical protein